MGSAAWVTPRLFVGEDLNLPHVPADSSEAAFRLIAEGETVLVPSWEIAEAVLRAFGGDETHISWVHSQL